MYVYIGGGLCLIITVLPAVLINLSETRACEWEEYMRAEFAKYSIARKRSRQGLAAKTLQWKYNVVENFRR